MGKLVKGNALFYDSERELHYCHIGLDNANKDLVLTVWGKTIPEVNERANVILGLSKDIGNDGIS